MMGGHIDGGWTEMICVPAAQVFALPQGVDPAVAPLLEPLAVAVHAVMEQVPLRAGDAALIIGAGPIGLLCGILALEAGASRVVITGVADDAGRLELARELGMEAVDVDVDDPAAAFGPEGADVIYETSGNAAVAERMLMLVRKAGRLSGLIIFLLIAPLLTSIIMRTFGWQVLFARRGLVNQWLVTDLGLLDAPLRLLNTPGLAIAALVHVLVPFAVLSIASVLQGIDRRLEEGALMLGASRFRTFWEVTLPLTMDGIGTGAILVFMIANGSFVTLVLLGGGFQTLPLLIYQQFNTTRDFALASTMSTILLVIALACLWLQLRLVRRQGV